MDDLLNKLPPTSDEIMAECIAAIADRHGLTVSDISRLSRKHRISHARQEVFWIARRMGLSLSKIAAHFGVDHTTVMHGVRQVDRRIRESDMLRHGIKDELKHGNRDGKS